MTAARNQILGAGARERLHKNLRSHAVTRRVGHPVGALVDLFLPSRLLLWVGQALATVGLIGAMLRAFGATR
jgi:hypothetical protein